MKAIRLLRKNRRKNNGNEIGRFTASVKRPERLMGKGRMQREIGRQKFLGKENR